MSLRASQPGKTAPKFLQDLLRFDPQCSHGKQNVLVDHAPEFDGRSRPPSLVLRSCKHEYVTHTDRSNLPHLDERPEQHTQWTVAAVCKRCRVYLQLFVQFPPDGCTKPCPNREFPLHHLRHASTSTSGVEFRFVCSNAQCEATVIVKYLAPVLSAEDLRLLTDEKALDRRYQVAASENPGRDLRLASPSDALYRLKRYVSDSLDPNTTRRTFPAFNKRFMEAFGSDCDELLQRLGFASTIEGEKTWTLPQPEPAQDSTNLGPMRAMLERLVLELQILIDSWCSSHAAPNPSSRGPWQDAKKDLERTLSAQAYDRVPGRSLSSFEEDHPHYPSLGALGDFSDQLIDFCYERQADCDPENGPYYFDCLSAIANNRSSDLLIMKSTTLASQDVLSKKDIIQAYRALGIEPEHASILTDQHIIGVYKSRWSDSGTSAQRDLKVSLKLLAQARGSQAMLDAASDAVETYEQALAYLDAQESTPDDMITALYGAKSDDSPTSIETARRAVEIIANQRNSDALRSWLATGQMADNTMSTDEACRHLQISLDSVDPSMLEFVFESAKADRPGITTDRAIEAVRRAMENQQATASHSTDTWPVGLISHGNTCYLNSLLQYYFTIKPLRDLILQFDQYRYDLATQGAKGERVGNLHRPAYEIESFQKLTDDLRHLFERMIKDRGPAVRPEADLVCRAFLKPTDPEADTSGNLNSGSVDVNMTSTDNDSTENEKSKPVKAEDSSSTASQVNSATLRGSVPGGEGVELPPSPPASPKEEKNQDQLAPPLPPRRPVTPSSQPKTNLEKAEEAARQQQDVAEVMEELLTRLRASIKPLGQDSQGEQLDQLREIFNTRITETWTTEGEAPVVREGDFTNIMLLPPYEPTDIYSALDRVLDMHPEPSTGKPVEMYKTIRSCPPILQISINRILMGLDGKPAKSEHRIKLEEVLYIDRYTENQDILVRRQQCWEWRRRLGSLQAEKEIIQRTDIGVDGPTALDSVSDWLSGISEATADFEAAGLDPVKVPEELTTDLSQESGLQKARLSVIEREEKELHEKISGQFAGFEQLRYRLHAVFFHRGSTGHGHYWTYIHDFRNNMWRVYNDEKVDEFSKLDDILNAHTWQQGTPTYAVYVRDDVKEQYVEPLCRDVEAVEEPTIVIDEPTAVVDEPMPDAPQEGWDVRPKTPPEVKTTRTVRRVSFKGAVKKMKTYSRR